jgi:hypothetical protein
MGFKEPAQRTKEGLCKLKLGFNKSLRVDSDSEIDRSLTGGRDSDPGRGRGFASHLL